VPRDICVLRDEILEYLASFEPGTYTGKDAAKLVGIFSEIERAGAAGKLLSARRVEETQVHEREGHKRAGTWLASVTGEPIGKAAAGLESVRAIEAHPEIREAFGSGRISEARAREIASAAEICPQQEGELVRAAEDLEFSELKRHCQELRVVASSTEEDVARYEELRKKRYCRIWRDAEGAGRIEARLTPDAFAVVRAGLGHFQKQVFEAARKEGRRETSQAYFADALVAMARSSVEDQGSRDAGTGSECATRFRRPRTLIRIRVDLEALKRGHVVAGETCSIPGAGPVPVELARKLLGESVLEMVITEGADVKAIVTNSRHISRALRIALEEREPVCCVPGCEASDPLEIDHWEKDYAKGGETKLENLTRLCSYHHQLKTHGGWRLSGPPGQWCFEFSGAPAGGTADQQAFYEVDVE
jgi:Domain of unknown function (DUF222)